MFRIDRPGPDFRVALLGLCVALLLIAGRPAWAIGTPAGTSIANLATLGYMVGPGVPAFATSNAVIVRVDEVIQPLLTWQDATPVAVSTPASDSVLSFLLTNAGNGSESFALARINGPPPLPPGNYTPQNGSVGSIYFESGLQAGFQASGPNADTAYVPGTNDPALAPDASLIIYVVSNTPIVAANAQGNVLLDAAALTPGAAGAAPGTGLAGLGEGGGFAVVGSSGAQANATGIMIASGIALVIAKTVQSVLDPHGTAVVMSGSVLTYRIAATLSGAGTASNLMITDPLPLGTTYVPGSIAVNGLARSDAADVDNAEYIAASRTVSVSLGNLPAPANILITLRAIID